MLTYRWKMKRFEFVSLNVSNDCWVRREIYSLCVASPPWMTERTDNVLLKLHHTVCSTHNYSNMRMKHAKNPRSALSELLRRRNKYVSPWRKRDEDKDGFYYTFYTHSHDFTIPYGWFVIFFSQTVPALALFVHRRLWKTVEYNGWGSQNNALHPYTCHRVGFQLESTRATLISIYTDVFPIWKNSRN